MARLKSAAAQAIRDMQAAEIEHSFFKGRMKEHHYLNDLIGIAQSYEPIVKIEVDVRVVIPNWTPPEVYHVVPRKIYRENPDGTISCCDDDEWDLD